MGAQRDITSAGTAYALDLSRDAHVHTGFAAGRDSVGVIVLLGLALLKRSTAFLRMPSPGWPVRVQ